MFTNLKNKLIEEVKASPSKFQQFANAAQAAVSSTTNSVANGSESVGQSHTNEQFFSVTDDDPPLNSTFKNVNLNAASLKTHNATTTIPLNNGTGPSISTSSSTRKLSISSVASDASFRVGNLEMGTSESFLLSDLDESGSEMGDTLSTTASLDVLTKEQLYRAYRNSLERYNKYRQRYALLAKKYKDLEHDSSKARSAMVKTQEKAIRRYTEMREQCALEQQAKAHLEESLRMEMDDMQCKIQAYQTKLKLLGENPDTISNILASNHSLSTLNDVVTTTVSTPTSSNNDIKSQNQSTTTEDLSQEDLMNESIKSLNEQLNEKNLKIHELIKQVDLQRKQEEENTLLLAQTKAAIHSELENKESEVNQLSNRIKQLENEIKSFKNIEKHNKTLTNEIKDMKEKLKQSTLTKQDLDSKLEANDHLINELKLKYNYKEKLYQSLEDKLQTLTKDNDKYKQQLQKLQQDREQLKEEMQQRQQVENNYKELETELNKFKEKNSALQQKCEQIDEEFKQHNELWEKSKQELHDRDQQLSEAKDTVACLHEHNEKLQAKILHYTNQLEKQNISNEAQEQKQQLGVLKHEQLATSCTDKYLEDSDNISVLETAGNEQNSIKIQQYLKEIEHLKYEMQKQQIQIQTLEKQNIQLAKDSELEKNDLKEQVKSILNEITQMEQQVLLVQSSHNELEMEKQALEQKIEVMQQQKQQRTVHNHEEHIDSQQQLQQLLNEMEHKLKITEAKLQNIEIEHTQMAEKNCLLEENTHRLEKLLADKDKQNIASAEVLVTEVQHKFKVAEQTIEKLQEKMSEALNQNTQLHNNKELSGQNYRALQDKYEALEKEKAELLAKLHEMDLKLEEQQSSNQQKFIDFEKQIERLQSENRQMDSIQNGLLIAKQQMHEKQTVEEELHKEIATLRDDNQRQLLEHQAETDNFRRQLNELQQHTSLQLQSLKARNQEILLEKDQSLNEVQQQQKKLDNLLKLQKELESVRTEEMQLRSNVEQKDQQLQQMTERVQQLEKEVQAKDMELDCKIKMYSKEMDSSQTEYDKIKHQLLSSLDEKQTLQQENLRIQSELQQVQQQMSNSVHTYKQQQNECEHLNKQIKQLQADLQTQQNEYEQQRTLNSEMQNKLQSLQCELYVFKEDVASHKQQVLDKDNELLALQTEVQKLVDQLNNSNIELQRQTENINYITEQDDNVKQQLHHTEQELKALEIRYNDKCKELEDYQQQTLYKDAELMKQNESCKTQNNTLNETIAKLQEHNIQLQEELEQQRTVKSNEVTLNMTTTQTYPVANVEHDKLANSTADTEHLRQINETLQSELENLKYKSSNEILSLQQDIDDLQASNKQMADRIMELEKLRAGLQAQKLFGLPPTKSNISSDFSSTSSNSATTNSSVSFTTSTSSPSYDHIYHNKNAFVDNNIDNREELENKLKTIMAEVQDVSNRNLFLEQKCENYLILEQSNERLKSQNAKLSRQLDETLVSLQHNDSGGISANTEFEYLKNIMFQYLIGSANGNNETLVKVISAVLKFSPQQTQVALEKEHQRRSLLNKII